jgi:ATP-binding protein involved in chromosome partitioning
MELSLDAVRKQLASLTDPVTEKPLTQTSWVTDLHVTSNSIRFKLQAIGPCSPFSPLLKQECERVLAGFEVPVHIEEGFEIPSIPIPGRANHPEIKNIIAVASGKGGVGKSTLCLNMALALAKDGAKVGVLDCDIYGPSLPSLVGMHEQIQVSREKRLVPHRLYNLQLMSMGFMLERTQAVTWRGPMLDKMLRQFIDNVEWKDLDYLLLDLPPGTGDVQQSVAQIMPVAGSIIVTTPQDIALRDVIRGFNMFERVQIPILGIVENYSYYMCKGSDHKHYLFGREGGRAMAQHYKTALLGEVPLDGNLPSPIGAGEPLMIRDADSPTAQEIRASAGAAVAQLARKFERLVLPGADALEV